MENVVKLVSQTKICKTCNEVKSISDFSPLPACVDGVRPICKKCRNARELQRYYSKPRIGYQAIKNRPKLLKKLYGITYEHVVQTLASQFGRCANIGCSKEISLDVYGARGNRAVIDHDHKTGKFRALLCTRCNKTLGAIESDENVFRGLIEYKARHHNN